MDNNRSNNKYKSFENTIKCNDKIAFNNFQQQTTNVSSISTNPTATLTTTATTTTGTISNSNDDDDDKFITSTNETNEEHNSNINKSRLKLNNSTEIDEKNRLINTPSSLLAVGKTDSKSKNLNIVNNLILNDDNDYKKRIDDIRIVGVNGDINTPLLNHTIIKNDDNIINDENVDESSKLLLQSNHNSKSIELLKGQYNDYINQTFMDLSRRPSVQEQNYSNDDDNNKNNTIINIENVSSFNIPQQQQQENQLDKNCDKTKGIIKSNINNPLKGIVKLPSNYSFVDDNLSDKQKDKLQEQNSTTVTAAIIEQNQNRFNLQYPDIMSTNNRYTTKSNQQLSESSIEKSSLATNNTVHTPDRPVLHVQFVGDQFSTTLSCNCICNCEYNTNYNQRCKNFNNSCNSCIINNNSDNNTNSNNHHHDNCSINSSGETSSSTSSSSSSSSTSSSSSEEDDSLERYIQPRAPDGGWGWVVVFASFMVNLIADGITFSFGVIYVEFLNYFGESKGKTAWIGSLFMAIPLLSGPIASFLTDRYGCRACTIAGSILSCFGFLISALSNSMELLFLTFGIIAGFGLSLCYVSAVVIVAYYFEKKRSFATGLSVCGSGIGTFIFAPLIQVLIDEYGWRGTTLILAGCFLNMTVCGLLMRDLEWTKHKAKLKAKARKTKSKSKKKVRVSAESFSFSNSTNTAGTSSLNQQHLHPNYGCACTCGGAGANTCSNGNGGQGTGNCGHENINFNENCDNPRLFSSLISLPTFIHNGEKVPPEVLELLSAHKNVHQILQKYPNLNQSRSFSEPYADNKIVLKNHKDLQEGSDEVNDQNDQNENNCLETNDPNKESANCNSNHNHQHNHEHHHHHHHHHHHNHNHNQPPSASYLKDLRLHRHSLTYRGAMLNINRYRLRASSCPDIYRNSMTTIAEEKTSWYQGIDEFKNLLLDILDFSYFADVKFLFFAMSNFLLYTWYDVPYVYIADNAIEIGIPEKDASMLISLIGIVNMFGEIFLGWIGDLKSINASVVYAVCMALCGAVTALVPLLTTYTWLCTISGAFGLFIAANYALTSIILVEIITIDKFTSAYGLLLLVQGVANLVGPPLAGWFCDVTGSYDLSFYVAGFFIVLSGAVLLIVPGVGKYRKYRNVKRQLLTNSDSPKCPKDECSNSKAKCNGTKIVGNCFEKKITGLNPTEKHNV